MTNEQLKELFALKHEDITKTFLQNMFACKNGKESLFDERTKITLDEKLLKETDSLLLKFKNIKDIFGVQTTIGRVIVNIFMYCDTTYGTDTMKISKDVEVEGVSYVNKSNLYLARFLDYVNEPLSKGNLEKINSIMAELYVNKEIGPADLRDYIDRLQWFGYTVSMFIEPSLDLKTIVPSDKIKKYKKEIISKNKDIIDSNRFTEFEGSIEKPILAAANEDLNNNNATGKIIYDSGYNGSFSNNFKNTSLFRGVAPKSNDPSSYSISMSNLTDGVQKKETDLILMYDLTVTGALGRAIDTRMGGYKTKIFNAAFAAIVLDDENTDCGSNLFYKIKLTKANWKDYKFRYIKSGSTLKEVNKNTIEDLDGKDVEMRSPLYCRSKYICNKCAGNLFYKLKIKNIGLMTNNISATLMNASMKSFHDLSLKPSTYDINNFISEVR